MDDAVAFCDRGFYAFLCWGCGHQPEGPACVDGGIQDSWVWVSRNRRLGRGRWSNISWPEGVGEVRERGGFGCSGGRGDGAWTRRSAEVSGLECCGLSRWVLEHAERWSSACAVLPGVSDRGARSRAFCPLSWAALELGEAKRLNSMTVSVLRVGDPRALRALVWERISSTRTQMPVL